jgi:hypothetical protein
MSNERIEVNFDDEDEQPKIKQQSPNRIIITNDDLASVPDTLVQQPQQMVYGQQPVYQSAQYQQYQKKGIAEVARGTVVQGTAAGLIGGILAWMITEPFFGDKVNATSVISIILEMGGFGALIGGIIGCCLGAAEGALSQVFEKALKAGAIGLGIGAAGGFLGGMLGQAVYGSLLNSREPNIGTVMIARILGWGIVGIFVGLGQGIGRGSGRRVLNGVIGGAIGGFVAGFLFDPIAMVVNSGVLSRAVGISILGTAAGLAISLVEEISKEAWLSVVQGPLSGKQFILYETRTRIGSSPKCEITLLKDHAIMPEHAVIENRGNDYVIARMQPQAHTLVNGQPVQHSRLQSGAIITVGSTVLMFEEQPTQGTNWTAG